MIHLNASGCGAFDARSVHVFFLEIITLACEITLAHMNKRSAYLREGAVERAGDVHEDSSIIFR